MSTLDPHQQIHTFRLLKDKKDRSYEETMELKTINEQLAREQGVNQKAQILENYPVKLTICPSNQCNLACALCPSGNQQAGRKPGLMTLKTFQKIMSECGPMLQSIDLYNWGEPFLNNDIFKMIQIAHDDQIQVAISTNLNILTDEMIDQIIESKLDILIISLDGVAQKNVAKYQTNTNVTKVHLNIKKIIDKRNELKVPYPKLIWRYIINKYNEKEIEEAKLLRKILKIDQLELSPIRCDMSKELFLTEAEQFENIKDWLPENPEFSMYNYQTKKKKIQLGPDCNWLWTQAAINWDGSVSPCCAVWDQQYDFGNIHDNSFIDIWNNDLYQQARSMVSGKTPLADAPKSICKTCFKNNAQIL